jgi:hypothetical protein
MSATAPQKMPMVTTHVSAKPGWVRKYSTAHPPAAKAAPRSAHFSKVSLLPSGHAPRGKDHHGHYDHEQRHFHSVGKLRPALPCPQAKGQRNMTLPEVS